MEESGKRIVVDLEGVAAARLLAIGFKAASAAVVLVAALAPAAAQAADAASGERARPSGEAANPWTKRVTVGLSARELGLSGQVPPRRLARVAIQRFAERLGLRRSLAGVRFARQLRAPSGPDGAAELRLLRFQQTVGGVRVVWSQIDVTIAAGEVSSIAATVVPVSDELSGERRVSRKRALAIARRDVDGAEDALRPMAVAHAGTPTTRHARPRTARLAWVVETTPASELGKESPDGLCIVVDATTGKVLARWKGSAARPGAGPARAAALTTLIRVWESKGEAGTSTEAYAIWRTVGDPFNVFGWPQPGAALYLTARTPLMDKVTENARRVHEYFCVIRFFCGRDGGFDGSFDVQDVVGNVPGDRSFARRDALDVYLHQVHVTPEDVPNDIMAHEHGHIMDWVHAGDRLVTDEGKEVEEALADMFAYDFDPEDPTLGEDTAFGANQNWADPGSGASSRGGRYPALMREYKCPPSASDPYHNSMILSHAYYLFEQKVGHFAAGKVLQYVPWFLDPRPRFVDVKSAFIARARQLYPGRNIKLPSEKAVAAREAFVDEVGIGRDVPTGGPC
jgi:hypothetical protein